MANTPQSLMAKSQYIVQPPFYMCPLTGKPSLMVGQFLYTKIEVPIPVIYDTIHINVFTYST